MSVRIKINFIIEKFELQNQNQINYTKQCENFNKIILKYLEVLEDLKAIKNSKNENTADNNNNNPTPIEKKDTFINKLVMAVNENKKSEDNSSSVDNSPSVKLEDNKNIPKEDVTEFSLKNKNFIKKMQTLRAPESKIIKEELNEDAIIAKEEVIQPAAVHTNQNIIKIVRKKSSLNYMSNLGLFFRGLIPEEALADSEDIPNERNISFKNTTKGFKWLKESIATTASKLVGFGNRDLTADIKITKNELALYKSVYERLSDEMNNSKSINEQMNRIISEFQENQKLLLDKEIENFSSVIKIYKHFYEEELFNRRLHIEELSKIIDDKNLK